MLKLKRLFLDRVEFLRVGSLIPISQTVVTSLMTCWPTSDTSLNILTTVNTIGFVFIDCCLFKLTHKQKQQ